MFRLQRLIDSLDQDELEQIKALRLEGKQAARMEETIRAYRSTTAADRALHAKGLSASHRDQINSVLLRRTLDTLVPEGGLSLLRLLARKQLPVIFRAEFLRIRRGEILKADPARRKEFYLGAAVLIGRLLRKPMEKRLLEMCKEGFAAAVKNNATERRVFDGAVLMAEIPFEFRHVAVLDDTIKRMKKRVAKYSRDAAKHDDDRLRFFDQFAHAQLHFWSTYNAEGYLDSIRRARAYVASLSEPIFADMPKRLDLYEVDALMVAGDTRGAFEGYRREFATIDRSEDLWDDPNFFLRYLELAIVNDAFDLADELLRTHCTFVPFVLPTTVTTNITLMQCVTLLLNGRYSSVHEVLARAFAANSKQNYNLFTNLRTRMIECSTFALEHDTKMVEVLSDRALQFLRSHKIGATSYNAGKYFVLVRAISRFDTMRMPIPAELPEAYALFTDGTFGVYGKLLEHLRSELSVKL